MESTLFLNKIITLFHTLSNNNTPMRARRQEVRYSPYNANQLLKNYFCLNIRRSVESLWSNNEPSVEGVTGPSPPPLPETSENKTRFN